MGVIQRQSIKSTLVSYLGIILGTISTLFIYPLNWEVYGKLQYWIASATLFAPILRLGSTSLTNKYFPYFQDRGVKGFLTLIIGVTTLTIVAMSILLVVVRLIVTKVASVNTPAFFGDPFYIIYTISLLMIYTTVLQRQIANYRRIVVPDLIVGFGLKITIPIIILISLYGFDGEAQLSSLLIGYYLVGILLLYFYSRQLGSLDVKGLSLKKISNKMKRSMFKYWIFGGLNYFGTLLAYKIDTIMIGSILGYVKVGYYSTFLFIAAVLETPFAVIGRISGPIISEALEKDRIKEVSDIYKKASRNLFLIGVFLFSVIWLNINELIDIMVNGEDIRIYKNIFLFLGIAKLFDMITSVNNLILVYSKWYQNNLYFLLILGAINITLNVLLISRLGILGAAMATFISILCFNLMKTLFIYVKLKVHPFSRRLLILMGILPIVVVVQPYLSFDLHPIVSTLIKTIVFSSLFLPLVWIGKVSDEFNQIMMKIVQRVKPR